MKITPLKMWVQNVLPVVYDDSLSYYEMVGKINEKTNEIIEQVNENTDDIEALNYVIQQLGDVDELKALLEEVETIVNDLYSSDTPVMDSENGSAGVADHAARSDHSHPSDSSKADIDSLAYINTGNTADRLYNPREYLVYNGQLYKVGNTAIGQGDTLVQDENIIAVNNGGFNDLISAINNHTASINKRELRISERRFLFIGDSYNSITGTAWSTLVSSILGLSNSAVVSQGGYGFVTGQNKPWLSLLQNATITDESTITDILICGGANDAWAGNNTIPTAMATFDAYVKGRFSGLQNIWVGFAGNSYKSLSEALLMRKAMREYIKGADNLNWHYLNNIETTLFYAGYIQKIEESGVVDMLHPNQNGVEKLSKNIAKCVLTGTCNNIHPNEEITFTINTSMFSSPSTIPVDESITDNILTVRINDCTLTPITNLTGNTGYTLATCADLKNMLRPGISLPVNVIAGTSNMTARLYFSDYNTLTLLLPSGVTIASGTNIYIRGAVFTFDYLF